MKRIFTLIVFAALSTTAFAEIHTWDCGYCGEWPGHCTPTNSVTATLNTVDSTLTIAGTGAMANYFLYPNDAPWYSYSTAIKTVVIDNGVTSIGYWAFRGCSGLTSVTISNSVTSIEQQAFYGCSDLTSVSIGNSVTSIGESAFSGCSSLISITIPNSVTSIGSSAFYGTTWYNNQPDGVVYAGKVLYQYKGTMPANTSITIEEGTLGIASAAFYVCEGLTSVTIPNSVTSIGYGAFLICIGLTSVSIGNSVTSIGELAFFACSSLIAINVDATNARYSSIDGVVYNKAQDTVILCPVGRQGTFTIPNSVTSIGSYAFYTCGLTSVTIPNSVTSIGSYAFEQCDGLTSVTIPNSVTSIGSGAFSGCYDLTYVIVNWQNPLPLPINNNVFDNSNFLSRKTLLVPTGTISKYNTANVWKDFGRISDTLSNEAALSSLSVSNYNISPSFNANTTSYTVSVPYTQTDITINAYRADWVFGVNGTGTKNLTVGNNVFNVIAIAADSTQKTYTITVTREVAQLTSLSNYNIVPAFNANTTAYTLSVPYNQSSITINASAYGGAYGDTLEGTGTKNLVIGNNTFDIIVKGENNSQKTYTITVIRDAGNNANLASLSVSGYSITPAFNADTINYTLTVPNNVSSITINAATADNAAGVIGTGAKNLNVGSNPFSIVVIAGNNSTKTYTITVTREAANNNGNNGGNNPTDPDNPTTAISTQNLAALPIYPNPTSDQITITSDQWDAVGAGSTRPSARPSIEIYNVNGTLVGAYRIRPDGEMQVSQKGVSGVFDTPLQGNTITINIGHLPAGIYIVKVGNKTAKVVKQ